MTVKDLYLYVKMYFGYANKGRFSFVPLDSETNLVSKLNDLNVENDGTWMNIFLNNFSNLILKFK